MQKSYLLTALVKGEAALEVIEALAGQVEIIGFENFQPPKTTKVANGNGQALNGSNGHTPTRRRRRRRTHRGDKPISEVVMDYMQQQAKLHNDKLRTFQSNKLRGIIVSEGFKRHSIGPALKGLANQKLIDRVGRGVYRLHSSSH